MNNTLLTGHNHLEVADIFQCYGNEYRSSNKMTKRQHAVMTAITNCRTDWFGYREDKCDDCGHVERNFNSCRDRHCPKCQGISQKKWITARLDDILPVPYYHIIFTLPHQIHPILRYNKKTIYNLLFSSASQTLLAFGRDPKWLGGEIGFYGVLHTWGQTLWLHPHLHFLVPGGALSDDGQWIEAPHRGRFLFPVHALSRVFRGKFIEALKEAHGQGLLTTPPDIEHLGKSASFERWLDHLVARNWVVYCKSPLKDAGQVVRYLGRYTHRVAIGNNRMVELRNDRVSFKYKDYKESRVTWKIMHLEAREFIRRFLWHVLPSGFHKIRHFGFLANGRRKEAVAFIRRILGDASGNDPEKKEWRTPCPVCDTGSLIPHLVVTRYQRIMLGLSSIFRVNPGGWVHDTT